jgi:hypothetical protein
MHEYRSSHGSTPRQYLKYSIVYSIRYAIGFMNALYMTHAHMQAE